MAPWVRASRTSGLRGSCTGAMAHLLPIRERVLDNARISPRDVVLDVGGGDGLIAFGAADLVGPSGKVILSDISADLVAHARELAEELGRHDRMSFVEAKAE